MTILKKLLGAGMPWGLANALEADIGDNLTATGTSQTDALQIGYAIARFTTVASGTGAVLQTHSVGDEVLILNADTTTLLVYPPLGHSINALSTNAAISVPGGSSLALKRIKNTLWQSIDSSQRYSVNAIDYGTMTTTPGADINRAITALGSTGGVVNIPIGNFQIETSILQTSNVTLRGQGIGATQLTAATGLNSPVIKNATSISSGTCTITRSGRTATATKTNHGYSNGEWVFISGADQLEYVGAQQIFNVSSNTFDFYVKKTATTPATGTIYVYKAVESSLGIEDLEIVGNASNTSGDNYGVRYHGVQNFNLKNLYVHGTYHMGIGIVSGVDGVLESCESNEVVHSQHDGFMFGTTNSGPSSTASYFANLAVTDCTALQNGQAGMEFVAGRSASVVNCQADRNVVGGFTTNFASDMVFTACRARLNTAHGIELYMTGGPENILVDGCVFSENGEAGIQLSNQDTANTVSRITLSNNICAYNAQIASTTAYGIAVENAAGATIDTLLIVGNTLTNNARGLSFGAAGTVSHVCIHGNIGMNNSADVNFGASLQTSTLTYGLNYFGSSLSAIKLLADATSGITFGNTANTDTSTLDWYEENTWTPVLTFATAGNLSVSYAARAGRFVRIGNTVFARCSLQTSAFTHTTASGAMRVTGLPYTSVSGMSEVGGGGIWQGITKASYTDITPYVPASTAYVQFAASGSGQSVAAISTGDTPTGGTVELDFNVIYST